MARAGGSTDGAGEAGAGRGGASLWGDRAGPSLVASALGVPTSCASASPASGLSCLERAGWKKSETVYSMTLFLNIKLRL